MRFLSIIILYSFIFCKSESQGLFKIVETKRTRPFLIDSEKSNFTQKYFKILCAKKDSSDILKAPSFCFKNIDTIEAIKDLLAYQGDLRINYIPVVNYDLEQSRIYWGKCRNYSIQVEALFLINQLIFDHPYHYSSYPVLVKRDTNEESSISGDIVCKAFAEYRKWYEQMKKIGIYKIKTEKIMPLDNSGISWY